MVKSINDRFSLDNQAENHHKRSFTMVKSTNDRFSLDNQTESNRNPTEIKQNPAENPGQIAGRRADPAGVLPPPPHAPTPAHPHTRSCTRIDFNTPRFSSFGKKAIQNADHKCICFEISAGTFK